MHTASVHGKITDSNTNKSLVGANVFISIEGSLIGAASDKDGFYQIEKVPKGKHTLEATYLGYENYVQTIQIGNDNKYEINLKLNTEAIESEEILITEEMRKEKKTESPASKEVIRSEDIKRVSNTNLGGYLK